MTSSPSLRLSLLIVALVVSGCVTTRQARSTTASPFLGQTASLLKPGPQGGALLAYIKPGVDWSKYQNIIIEPVTTWVGAGENDGLTGEERKALCNYLNAALREAFSKQFKVIDDVSAPNTLRYSAAIISAKKSWPVLSTVSTVVPMALAVSTLKALLTGKPSFVGEVDGEALLTDSITGEVLGAAADKRVGGMGWKGKLDRWGAVEYSGQYWAKFSVYRICMLQGKSGCEKPSDY
jgi:hypothetical protein